MKNIRITAFTLAEVLITIGIIGIVAAMTFPILIKNHQKVETLTRLKKAYTILNQAIKLSENDNGDYNTWSTNITAIEYYQLYWFPYIKAVTVCNNATDCGYKKELPWTLETVEYSVFSDPNWRIPFLTSDGFLYSISVNGSFEDSKNLIIIDINGSKNPNEIGRDLFFFTRTDKGLIQGYGYDKSNIEINNDCSENGKKWYCGAKIISDGWTIKKDYPWK